MWNIISDQKCQVFLHQVWIYKIHLHLAFFVCVCFFFIEKGYTHVELDSNTTNIQAVTGQDISVCFEVASYPEAEHRLMKGQEVVDNLGSPEESTVENVVKLSAHFNDILESNEGNYTLTAWNDYETSSAWFYLEVLGENINKVINPLSTKPHKNVVWYNNSWLDFLKILNYVPKEREKYTAKNEPSFVTGKCCDGS